MSRNKQNYAENIFESYSNNRKEQTVFTKQTKASDTFNEDEPNKSSIGEFSPNNPKMRVAFQPDIGIGEYDHRRQMLNDQRKADYQQHTEKVKRAEDQHTAFRKSNFRESHPEGNGYPSTVEKNVQIDIKDVNSKHVPDNTEIEKQKNSTGFDDYMDRFEASNNTSKLKSGSQRSVKDYVPPTVDEERFEKVRKQEKYSAELRQQIEAKQMMIKKHKDDEKHQDDLESARVETQMRNLNMNPREGHAYGRHCYSPDVPLSDVAAPVDQDKNN